MQIFITNDYRQLKECVLCYPCNVEVVNPNNPNKVDKKLASYQYNTLIDSLMGQGCKVHFMELKDSPSQTFTRDIGFIIDDILFISNMKDPVRKGEIEGLIELADKNNIQAHIMQENAEGGDIVVDNELVFVGQGKRTTAGAAEEIQQVLKNNNKSHQIIKVAFDVTKIHLDCVFNILDKDTCIVSNGVSEPEVVNQYFSNVIWASDEDLNDLAPNIIQLGNNKYLCSSKNFTSVLQNNGFDTAFIDFSEFIKCKGSLGCCVLPLLRR